MNARRHAIQLAASIAPNNRVQEAIAQMVKGCDKDHLSEKEVVRHIVSVIYDGLTYGNWLGLTNEECHGLRRVE